MATSLLEKFAASLKARPVTIPDEHCAEAQQPDEPTDLPDGQRTAKRCPAPPQVKPLFQSLAEVRTLLPQRFEAYLAEKNPGRMLLVNASAGVGKTYAGIDFAHAAHEQTGKRVMYLGPRHDLFPDIFESYAEQGHNPFDWLEWLPRQTAEAGQDKLTTCLHTGPITEWIQRGYDSHHFCYRVCGDAYMKNDCYFLRQSQKPNPLIYGQHQHLVSNHPLADQCGLLLGDENPMAVFSDEWEIPADRMYWSEVAFEEPLAHVLYDLEQIARSGLVTHGIELYQRLGPQRVIDACESFDLTRVTGNKLKYPYLRDAEDALEAGYNVLPTLVPLLLREARAARHQLAWGSKPKLNAKPHSDFLERLWIRDQKLILLGRKHVADTYPHHVIWFDATGKADLYAALFERPVETINCDTKITGKIYQIPERANNKTALMHRQPQADVEATAATQADFTWQAEQLKQQIAHVTAKYVNPVVVTFKGLKEYIGAEAHFYANRGTNLYQDRDAIVIAGTPMPPIHQVEKLAKCIWFDRMLPFDHKWIRVRRPYNYVDEDGFGWDYPVSEFADPLLNIVLWQMREAEIIQSAHRARILFRDVPVYLLCNLPIQELPLTQLITTRDLMDAPPEVDIYLWEKLMQLVEETYTKKGFVALSDLTAGLDIHRHTAMKYMDILCDTGDWEPAIVKTGKPGQPPRAMQKTQ